MAREYDDNIRELISLYVSGEISPEEERELEAAIRQDAWVEQELETAEKLWSVMKEASSGFEPDSRKGWEVFSGKIASGREKDEEHATRIRVLKRRRTFLWAASIAVVISVMTGLLLTKTKKTTPSENKGMIVVAAAQPVEMYLPDSSFVRLKENTKLYYKSGYGSDERTVWLNGDAYFEVERDETRPFIVKTRQSETIVLGTAFEVRARAEVPFVEVEVMSGKVCFQMFDGEIVDSLILRRNETGIYDLAAATLFRKTLPAPEKQESLQEAVEIEESDVEEIASENLEPVYKIDQNMLKQTVINLELKNNANQTTYENIEVIVRYSTKRGDRTRKLRFKDKIPPGGAISARRRLKDWFVDSEVQSVEVQTAEGSKGLAGLKKAASKVKKRRQEKRNK